MIKTFNSGLLGSNTHLFYDESTLDGMIIDCGNKPDAVSVFCQQKGINVKYIVLTHGHYDHAHYVKEYKDTFKSARALAHKDEACVLTSSTANVSVLVGDPSVYPCPDETLSDGEIITVGETEFRVIHTPGHTPGGICLYSEKENIMFTGDTLFFGGRGRTDFMYGDEQALLCSLRELTEMDGEIDFYSGHGSPGKIKYEKGMY